jgi:hypothetical protein
VTGYLGVIAAMDSLFERVVADPPACGDELLAAWMGEVLGTLEPPLDKSLAREVRRAARLAGRLGGYWSARPTSPPGWRVSAIRSGWGTGEPRGRGRRPSSLRA